MQTLSKHIIFQPKHTPADLEPGAVREAGSGGATARWAEDGGPEGGSKGPAQADTDKTSGSERLGDMLTHVELRESELSAGGASGGGQERPRAAAAVPLSARLKAWPVLGAGGRDGRDLPCPQGAPV